jgi:anti-sigma28 factor (negative regulator of flagellin synthesis)
MSNSISNVPGLAASGIGTVSGTQGALAPARAAGAQVRDGDGDHGIEPSTQPVSTSVSALASAVSRSAGGVKGASSFRPELVSQLRAQIASGTYRPDMQQTAAVVSRALARMP